MVSVYTYEQANKDFNGKIEVGGSHIAPFANFPNISIDLEHLKIYESKADSAACLLHLKDTYLGFDLTKLLSGDVVVKKIKLSDGRIDIRQHKDGSFNIANALASKVPSEEVSEDLHLSLESIILDNVDISKLNESTNLGVDLLIKKAESRFHSHAKGIDFELDSDLKLSIIQHRDTTFFNNKHLEFQTQFSYLNEGSKLEFKETSLAFEKNLLAGMTPATKTTANGLVTLTYTFKKATKLNAVVLQELIEHGQRVKTFTIEAKEESAFGKTNNYFKIFAVFKITIFSQPIDF